MSPQRALFNSKTQHPVKHTTQGIHNLTILLHIYYPGSWAVIKDKCAFVVGLASQIIITTCHDDVIAQIDASDKITILKVTNRGKDIGGKLAALSYYLHFCARTSYLILLHDKISPQTINAQYWLENLYSIFSEELFGKAIHKLKTLRKIGIIGSKIFLKNEYVNSKKIFATTNDEKLRQLINEYSISCKQYNFIAGTIFIARSKIFEDFFSVHAALSAREKLEAGNVLDLVQGSYTHSWERLLCFIAEDQGYIIKGI